MYGAYSLSASSFGVAAKEVTALHKDLRAEVARGGLKGLVCRVVQPIVWLLALPMESLSSALALAAVVVCTGALL